MTGRHAVVAALAVAILSGTQGVGYADPTDRIHLTVRVSAPRFGDQNDLIYRVDVANLGPARATGVVARQSTVLCATRTTPLAACQRIPPTTFLLAGLDPGGGAAFPVVVRLPTGGAVVVRTTVEVVRADQPDAVSTLGACQDGQHPQCACDTRVTEVSP